MSDLGWQNLEVQRAVSRLTLMFKIVHSLVDVGGQILVRSGCATGQSTGQHHLLQNVQAHQNCYRSSFFPCTIPDPKWNHLPLHNIRNATSVGCMSSIIRDLDAIIHDWMRWPHPCVQSYILLRARGFAQYRLFISDRFSYQRFCTFPCIERKETSEIAYLVDQTQQV